jgi:hypothetical protein
MRLAHRAAHVTCIELLALFGALVCMALGALLGLKLGVVGAIVGGVFGAVGGFYCTMGLVIGLARILVYFDGGEDERRVNK